MPGPGESFDAALSGGTAGDAALTGDTATPGSTGPRSRGGLRNLAARGIVINTIFLVALNALGFIKGFGVAAFLTPVEYGLWGLLAVAFSTLFQLVQVGVNDKYIQQDQTDQELAFREAFTMQALLCGVFVVVILVAMPLYAIAYGTWDVLLPGYVLALAIPANALQVPLWTYYRTMDFFTQRKLQIYDPIVAFVVTMGLAAAGMNYWSLVLGVVAGAWVGAYVAVRNSPYRMRLSFRRDTLREYWGFSGPLFYAALMVIVIAQTPVLVGQHVVGLLGIGAMAVANNISQYAYRVDDIITDTLYPAVCAVKDRSDLLLESFAKSNRLALLWGMPLGAALVLFAPDIVHYILGEKWEVATFAIQIVGLTAGVNQIGFNWTAFYRAMGETKPIAWVSAWTCVGVLAFAIPLLVTDGVDGYVIGMAAAIVVSIVARVFYLARLFPLRAIVLNCLRGMLPTLPGAAAALAVRAATWGGERGGLELLAELAAFAVAVAVTTLYSERALMREFRGYLSRAT